MVVIKLVNKDDYFNNVTSYDNNDITILKPLKCDEREMKCKLRLTH